MKTKDKNEQKMFAHFYLILFVLLHMKMCNGQQGAVSDYDEVEMESKTFEPDLSTIISTKSSLSSTQTTVTGAIITKDSISEEANTTPKSDTSEAITYSLIGVSAAFVILACFTLILFIRYRRLRSFRSDVAYEIGPFKG